MMVYSTRPLNWPARTGPARTGPAPAGRFPTGPRRVPTPAWTDPTDHPVVRRARELIDRRRAAEQAQRAEQADRAAPAGRGTGRGDRLSAEQHERIRAMARQLAVMVRTGEVSVRGVRGALEVRSGGEFTLR